MQLETRKASPKRFVQVALQLLSKDAASVQVFRLDPSRGDVAVDVDTIQRRPGSYVLRTLEEHADSGEEVWIDVASTEVSLEDDAGETRHSAAAKGEALKDEGWRILVQNYTQAIALKDAEIAKKDKKLEERAEELKKLNESLAEAHAELERGAGRIVQLIERFGPSVIALLQGGRFRHELARRVQKMKLPKAKQEELVALLNSDEFQGPSDEEIPEAKADEDEGE